MTVVTDKIFFLKKLHSYVTYVNLTYMKKCSKCLEIKPLLAFYKKIRYPDGYDYTCKQCQRPGENKFRNNAETHKGNVKSNLSPAFLKLESARTLLKLGKISLDRFNHVLKEYRNSVKKDKNKRYNERLKNDPVFRAVKNSRNRLKSFMKSKRQYSKSLGCSAQELRSHIEHQFKPGMSWDNYGEWELDHIVPLALAYKQGPEAFLTASKYTNLQPLWKADHIVKSREDLIKIRSYDITKVGP